MTRIRELRLADIMGSATAAEEWLREQAQVLADDARSGALPDKPWQVYLMRLGTPRNWQFIIHTKDSPLMIAGRPLIEVELGQPVETIPYAQFHEVLRRAVVL